MYPVHANPCDYPHPLRLSVEFWVLEKSTNIGRDLRVSDVQINEGVGVMAKALLEKIEVLSEERRPMKGVENSNQIFVFDPVVEKVFPNLLNRNLPFS
jgi:hypothetical protein